MLDFWHQQCRGVVHMLIIRCNIYDGKRNIIWYNYDDPVLFVSSFFKGKKKAIWARGMPVQGISQIINWTWAKLALYAGQ
jgi:hypothetical protein